jgi:NEDD8-activating enzyme E1 regulatory subunit
MKRKFDEENFDEALSQAYRALSDTKVPFDIAELFSDPVLASPLTPTTPLFFHLLDALRAFTEQAPFTLPLSASLPDMKADTKSYVHLQNLYKEQAKQERETFTGILRERTKKVGLEEVPEEAIDEFVKHTHALRIVRGRSWTSFDKEAKALGMP